MKCITLTATSLIALCTASAHAGAPFIIEVDLDGWQTWGGLGSPNNTTIDISIAHIPNPPIIEGVGWDLTIESLGASWNSEVAFDIDGGVVVTPGTGTTGTGSYSSGGIIFLADANLPNIIVDDDIISIEVFETFDDPNNTDTGLLQDANITGTLFIQLEGIIPAPASITILVAAVGLTGRPRRR